MNDILHPHPRADDKPSDVASSALASSSDSSNSYNSDDARRFFREWRAAEDRYSKAIWNNSQLEIRLGVFQAALNAAEEEASVIRAWLAESDAAVVGKTKSMNASILISTVFILIVFCDHQPRRCSWSQRMRPRMPSMLGVPSLTLVSKTSWPTFRRLPSTACVTARRWR